jgi:hypothetical protein
MTKTPTWIIAPAAVAAFLHLLVGSGNDETDRGLPVRQSEKLFPNSPNPDHGTRAPEQRTAMIAAHGGTLGALGGSIS